MTESEKIGNNSVSYETLTRTQLIALLKKRDAERKLGLVWERDLIDMDAAIDDNFVVADLVAEQCERPAPWDNLVIEGDNYDALRWLRMTHRGKIKCIYIDPPYNTGNKDWVYNDNYVDPNHRYRHSQWLEFLYQRLTLARDLLTADGVILISINDENRAKLELMADQVLPGMRLGTMTWRTRQGSNADQGCFMSHDHEHVLVFGRTGFRFSGTEKSFDMYKFDDEDGNGAWRKSDLTLGFSFLERPNLYYPLHDDQAEVWYPCNPNGVWRYASEARLKPGQRLQAKSMDEFTRLGQIIFPKDNRVETYSSKTELISAIKSGDVPMSGRAQLLREDLPDLDFWVGKKIGWGTPAFKRYRKDLKNQTQPLSSWITPNAESKTVPDDANMIVSGTNDEGAKIIKDVFGEKAFNYAKPVSLIRELVRQSTSHGDIVLDFFAGSSTTAQAVMELNAEDNGDRKFIMASSTEATFDDPDKNICRDVTAERIRRININDDKYEHLSAGFAYLRCREIEPLLIDEEITPEGAWHILEAHHGLPLTEWGPGARFALHEGEAAVLVLIDQWSEDVKAQVLTVLKQKTPVFIYAFEPGQVTGLDTHSNAAILNVRGTLRRLFAS